MLSSNSAFSEFTDNFVQVAKKCHIWESGNMNYKIRVKRTRRRNLGPRKEANMRTWTLRPYLAQPRSIPPKFRGTPHHRWGTKVGHIQSCLFPHQPPYCLLAASSSRPSLYISVQTIYLSTKGLLSSFLLITTCHFSALTCYHSQFQICTATCSFMPTCFYQSLNLMSSHICQALWQLLNVKRI